MTKSSIKTSSFETKTTSKGIHSTYIWRFIAHINKMFFSSHQQE